MKILQVNTVVSYGSTGIICQNIARGLIAQGHDCLTVYGRGGDVKDIPTIKVGNRVEQGLHYLQSRFLDQHGLGSHYATKELVRIVKNYQPDIIHLHNIHGYYLNYKTLFKELQNLSIPVVWLLHDQWAISGGPAFIETAYSIESVTSKKIERTQAEKKQYPYVSRIALKRFKKNILNKYQVITSMSNLTLVTPSKWLEYFIKDTFLGKFQIVTIYNGIDTNRFTIDYADNSEKSKKINILGAANVWDDRKGLKYFCRLAEDLGSDFHITLVGVDDSIDLPPNISRVGRLDSKQMVAYYNHADVFVNPTLGDNFPSVNVEAQLCGTPVITFDTGGSGESICRETGIIIEKGDYQSLLRSLQSIKKKNSKITRVTRAYAEKFSIDIMVDQYMTLFQKNYEEQV